MIWDSTIWKEDLFKAAQRLSRRKAQRRWTERSLMLVEKDVFVGFYAVRMLLQAKKLSEGFERIHIAVERIPSVGKPVTHMNYHRVDELYDFGSDQRERTTLSLMELCTKVVHSFVFFPGLDEAMELGGVLLGSDRERNSWVYVIDIAEVIALFEAIASDDIHELVFAWDKRQQDQHVVRAINRGMDEDNSRRSTEYIASHLP